MTPAGPQLTDITATVQGVVIAVKVGVGDFVVAGDVVVVLESMKMEHPARSEVSGTIAAVHVGAGDNVGVGKALVALDTQGKAPAAQEAAAAAEPAPDAPTSDAPTSDAQTSDGQTGDLDEVRPELAELFARRAKLVDAGRPTAVERRHETGKRTARELIADICDVGTFAEYGGFAVAAQSSRRSVEDLRTNTPADGLVAGIAQVNGALFPPDRARCAVLAYDYSVLAGTQGQRNHQKKDRIFGLVARLRIPVVLFAEGGGGRPGDTDYPVISGLDTEAFALYAKLSGLVPLVGIVQGRCFAGNAALLGMSDVIIATSDSNIGMGGPAMIEGGGLGVFAPEDIGPAPVQAANGVIDVLVADDVEAVAVAKKYLGYFQGDLSSWTASDQRVLRHLVPERRSQTYDIRAVITGLADELSVLELRQGYAAGMVTCLARMEGKPVGIIANDSRHLGGAIDTPGADKAARFMQLCDAFSLPLVLLCDTPGFMVGPEAETSAQVRHFSRMFVVGASLSVPHITVVLRKGYGLGAQAMAGGSFRSPIVTLSWPTGEFGGMGLEGAVRLSMRKELAAVADLDEREALYAKLVAHAYERGKALSMATNLEIDDVIDPAETRDRVVSALAAGRLPPWQLAQARRRPCVDPW